MANVKFRLRKPDRKIKTPQKIYMVYNFGSNEKLVYSTPFSVLPKYWNKSNQRIGNYSEVLEKDEINNYLNRLFTDTEKFITGIKAKKQLLTKDVLKNYLDDYSNPKTVNENSFFGFIEKFIQQSETRINPDTGQKISSQTIQNYKTALRVLKEFAAQSRRVVDFDTIDMDFYSDFTKFMQNYVITDTEERKDIGFSTNTMGKYITTLKAFLNEATRRGINNNLTYKNRSFKVVREDSENVYLNENELQLIYDLDLSKNPRLERVRDLFIVGAWTGLRFGDLTQMTTDKIKNDFLNIEQRKTGNRVVIPIHWTVKEIIKKYNGELPREISNQKMNDYIKEVCELVELKEKVHKAITKGGTKVSKKYNKWQLVSSHTARRSFATNLYLQGFPSISIMQITGHKTEKAFMKYIKVTPDEHAKLLEMHWQNRNKLRVI
jgi:integrase